MSVRELYTQLFPKNWRNGRFARILSQGCSEKIRKKDILMTVWRWSSWSIQIPQFLMLWWPAMKAGSTAVTQTPRDRVPRGSMLAFQDPRRQDRVNPLCWGFKGVQEEIPREEASTLQIGSVAFPPGQCTSLQLHPCHRLFDRDGHQDSSSPSLESRPCSLWLLVIP